MTGLESAFSYVQVRGKEKGFTRCLLFMGGLNETPLALSITRANYLSRFVFWQRTQSQTQSLTRAAGENPLHPFHPIQPFQRQRVRPCSLAFALSFGPNIDWPSPRIDSPCLREKWKYDRKKITSGTTLENDRLLP